MANLPSGLPSGLPMGPSNPILATYRFVRDTRGYLQACAKRYGDPFTLPLLDGPKVVVGAPELLREIFAAEPDIFDATTPELLSPLFGVRSLPLASGALHRRKRKLMAPVFHAARMRVYGQLMVEITQAHLRSLLPGQPIDALALSQGISLEVIIRAVYGARQKERVALLRAAILENQERFTPILLYFPFLRRRCGGYGPWSRYQRASAELDRLLKEELESRRREASQQDVLSMLLECRDEDGGAMDDDEVCNELRALLIAGHETSATAMAWVLYEVYRHPEVAARLQAELAEVGTPPDAAQLAKLPYLCAVCDETLRMYPIAPVTLRRLNRPHRFGDRDYPAETQFAPALLLSHYNPRCYPEPDTFRPERFLGRSYAAHEYFPYGGGARRCLGAALAGYELKIVLGTMLQSHRFALATQRPIPNQIRGVTMGPKNGIPLRYLGPC